MLSLSDNNQADLVEAFNSTSRYLDTYSLNIDNPYFEQMLSQIYPTELQSNKANSSDTEVPFLDLDLSITNGIVFTKIYVKRDDFNFEIVNLPFLGVCSSLLFLWCLHFAIYLFFKSMFSC